MFKQTEDYYKNLMLGFGSGSIYNFGCYLVSLTNGLVDFGYNFTPRTFNQFLKDKKLFTGEFGNYIDVDRLPSALPDMFTSYKRTDNWIGFDSVDWYLSRDYILVAKVDARGIGGSGSHFVRVVSTTKKTMTVIQDPWFGTTDNVTKHYNNYGNILSFRIFGVKRKNDVSSSMETMKTYSQEEWQKERDERNKNWNLYQEEKKTSEKLQTTIQGLKEEIERLKADAVEASAQIELRKKELAKFKEDLAKILYLPAASDAADIEGAVRRLLEVEDQLKDANKKIVQEEKKHALEKDELQKEVNDLKAALAKQEAVLAKQAETNQKLLGRVEDLEKKLNQQQESADITTRWKTFINKLLRLFNEK